MATSNERTPKVYKILVNRDATSGTAADPIPNYLTFATIQNGSTGNDVKFAQEMLYIFMPDYAYGLVADGIFGPNTKAVVQTFQSYNNLTTDGVVGPNTWQRLAPIVMAGYAPPTYWRADYVVRHVQTLLVLGGRLNNDDIDGVFGTRTENAIKAFQSVYGLLVDGKWGRQCWNIIAQGYI